MQAEKNVLSTGVARVKVRFWKGYVSSDQQGWTPQWGAQHAP